MEISILVVEQQAIGGGKKKINPYPCQLAKERTNQENNHSIV